MKQIEINGKIYFLDFFEKQTYNKIMKEQNQILKDIKRELFEINLEQIQ